MHSNRLIMYSGLYAVRHVRHQRNDFRLFRAISSTVSATRAGWYSTTSWANSRSSVAPTDTVPRPVQVSVGLARLSVGPETPTSTCIGSPVTNQQECWVRTGYSPEPNSIGPQPPPSE